MSSPSSAPVEVAIRRATPGDAEVCGRICFEAFSGINQRHGFPCDFPGPEAALHVISSMFSHPGFYCVVAEAGGRIIGSNCLDERAVVTGVGPITVDPGIQNTGVGRRLMQAVLDRVAEQRATGVRLLQAAFHNRSMALYTGLGFAVREPIACLQGRTRQREVPRCMVRMARPSDLENCSALCRRVHGFERGRELADALQQGGAKVVIREDRITGYTSGLAFFGHSVGETNVDLQALIASADSFGGAGILVPSRNSVLFAWCLANGLRIVQPMTLMSKGIYTEPAGPWLPSISF